MTLTGAVRASIARQQWPVAAIPRNFASYLLAVDAAALVWLGWSIAQFDTGFGRLRVLIFLAALALVFEEGARRAARMQLRLSSDLKRDMISVWAVCGAVPLRPAAAASLLVLVLIYVWFRQQRPAGEPLYRKWFNGSTELLGCLAGSLALQHGSAALGDLPWALGGLASVLLAITVYGVVNRALVTIALLYMGARGKELLGTRDDNLVELATLCLGGLVSLAVIYQPWTAVLVLAPMVALQRGAVVRELETAATTDAKTGLLNAVAWEQLAKRELERGTRQNYQLGLLLIDVDRFKVVNDRFGHLAGDAVLRGIGRCLSAAMRDFDAIGRFGGEEFVAVLPNVAESEALVVAERTRSKINQLSVSDFVEGIPEESDLALAVSIGVSCTPVDGQELHDLLHAADGALYRAKAMGRNRVVLADRGACDPFIRASMN